MAQNLPENKPESKLKTAKGITTAAKLPICINICDATSPVKLPLLTNELISFKWSIKSPINKGIIHSIMTSNVINIGAKIAANLNSRTEANNFL